MKSSIVKLANGTEIKLTIAELPDEVMVDRILFIDYSNIYAEIATLPVLMNKIGFLLSECENEVRLAELKLKRWKSKKREESRISYIKLKGKFTIDQVDDAVRIDPQYVLLNTAHIKLIKQRDDMNSLFWSLKGKQTTLENLSKSMNMLEFKDGLVNSTARTVNYVDMKIRKPLIGDD